MKNPNKEAAVVAEEIGIPEDFVFRAGWRENVYAQGY